MAEQAAEAIDNGETEAEAAMGVAPRQPIEFTENVAPLVLRNPRAAVPYLDADGLAAPAATDDHSADGGVADGVGNQVEQDAPEQDRIAAHPPAARHHPERQFLVARRLGEGGIDSPEHMGNRKLRNLSAEHAGVEPRNV